MILQHAPSSDTDARPLERLEVQSLIAANHGAPPGMVGGATFSCCQSCCGRRTVALEVFSLWHSIHIWAHGMDRVCLLYQFGRCTWPAFFKVVLNMLQDLLHLHFGQVFGHHVSRVELVLNLDHGNTLVEHMALQPQLINGSMANLA